MSHDASVEQQILTTIDKWVEQELRPIAREFDQADEYPSDLVEQMKELGLFGATISEEYGGLGLSASTYARWYRTHRARCRIGPARHSPRCQERRRSLCAERHQNLDL